MKLRKQNTGESFANFVKDLRLIPMDCEYTDPDDILIDSIIVGVHAEKLQERLLDRNSSQSHRSRATLRNVREASMRCSRRGTSHLSTGSEKTETSNQSEET